MLNKIYYWWHRRKYSYPHRNELLELFLKLKWKMDDSRWKNRKIGVVSEYIMGESFESISIRHNITRERIRQILSKFYRDSINGVHNQPSIKELNERSNNG